MRAPERLVLVCQPVVEVHSGAVAGYEILSRFPGPSAPPPDEWFAAAWGCGLGVDLELHVLRRALALRDRLPVNAFLTVNLSPALVLTPQFAALAGTVDWRLVVLELTEHARVDDYERLRGALEVPRGAGAMLAIDDAGAGYASLSHVLALLPDFVKLDRGLVDGIDADPAKRADVEMFGDFAARIDAWIVAEGVERAAELAELKRLGVPLAQGWYLGRPGAPWRPVEHDAFAFLTDAALSARSAEPLRPLVDQRPSLAAGAALDQAGGLFAAFPGAAALAAPDRQGRPRLLVRRTDVTRGRLEPIPAMLVDTRMEVSEALRRAMTRPLESRYDPLIAHDDLGSYVGMIGVDRLVLELLAATGTS